MEMLPQQNNKPAFVFNTYGFIRGRTLRILDELASEKGFNVIAGHSLHTPESYPPMIARGMGNEKAPNDKEMKNCLLPVFSSSKARKEMGEKFVDGSLCTECLLCSKLCPYGAIRCSTKPVFDMNKCCGCWTCYNHCPVKAIYTKKFRGMGHYPQPINQLREKLRVG